jgi:hypothetical protein
MSRENLAFTTRAIARAQRLSIEQPFCAALTAYLASFGRVIWDDARALFWVIAPNGPPQVAVWLMPVAEAFDATPASARAAPAPLASCAVCRQPVCAHSDLEYQGLLPADGARP